jgi:hypothetical protein
MADKQFFPYRSMPLRYSLIWMVVFGGAGAYQVIRSDGWPPASIPELVSTAVVGAMVGYFIAWISWRAGAHKKHPPNSP